jgi:NAD-reducing hydrogenase large subunit
MADRILINPVTRIEGHAKISIYVNDDGAVSAAQFHVVEFRAFEKICLGRPFHEMPGLMARTCGICPVSHALAASKAGDALLGVEVPETAHKLRRLMNYGQHLQSHALSFFHLSSPDMLLGFDSDPKQRNILGLAETEPDLARRGVRLRQFGQRVIELVGGRRIHPPFSTPGGMQQPLSAKDRDEIASWLPEALESVRLALACFKRIVPYYEPEIHALGNFPSLFLGTVTEDGKLELYDGLIRIVDSEGNTVVSGLNPQRYHTYLEEASEEWTFMKFPYYKPLGYPGGAYRVGPLARLNVCDSTGTPFADRELREFRQANGRTVCASFFYHWARLIEMLHAVERIEELVADPGITNTKVRARAGQNRNVGIGSCEAPRGTLFHHFEVDNDGLVRKANLLIATGQNNMAMNRAVEQAAMRFVQPNRIMEGALNRVEAAIRCFDPCLSCATHAVGQMPLQVELRDLRGNLLDSVTR